MVATSSSQRNWSRLVEQQLFPHTRSGGLASRVSPRGQADPTPAAETNPQRTARILLTKFHVMAQYLSHYDTTNHCYHRGRRPKAWRESETSSGSVQGRTNTASFQ